MYKKFKLAFLLFSLLILLLTFSSCEEPELESKEPMSVCVLYGNTRNVGVIEYDVLKDEITDMANSNSDCSVIVLDGKPNTYSYSKELSYPSAPWFMQKSSNDKYIENTVDDIIKCIPSDNEIDILSALQSAESVLSESKKKKKIVIFSSGISTAGELNFYKYPELIEQSPNVIVNMLTKSKSMPELKGVTVEWHGFGVVESPQEKLTKINEYRLKKIWNTILKKSGAKIEGNTIKSDISSDSNYDINEVRDGYPSVNTVAFPEIIEIDDTKVEFKINSDEFLNKKKAYRDLKPYANLILESGCKSFYLVGSTASDRSKEECIGLSNDRAKTVKKVLCHYKVPSFFLKTYGIGRENFGGEYKWRVNDLDANGILITDLAQKNRKVMIIEESSEKGKEFIQIWNNTMKKN